MPIDGSGRRRLEVVFREFSNLPFPKLPEADDLADFGFSLLQLDPAIAGKVARVLNGNMSEMDFADLARYSHDVQSLQEGLEQLEGSTADEGVVVEGLLTYVRALRDVSELALRTQVE